MTEPAAPRRLGKTGHPERAPRLGLAPAGGGPLGAIYEIGALLALAEAFDGIGLRACAAR